MDFPVAWETLPVSELLPVSWTESGSCLMLEQSQSGTANYGIYLVLDALGGLVLDGAGYRAGCCVGSALTLLVGKTVGD
jgi:hypothetical protein